MTKYMAYFTATASSFMILLKVFTEAKLTETLDNTKIESECCIVLEYLNKEIS